jgi:23S rRNA (uracil1939-C5)-methyltransferase
MRRQCRGVARIELRPTAVVAGGDAIAHEPSGRVVFVTGALPGERVLVEVDEERRDFARGHAVEVVDGASPDRVAPPCANVAAGCGGCGWQHVAPAGQLRLKEAIVADALRRVGGLGDRQLPPISTIDAPAAQRTTLRLAVRDGHPAFHRHRGRELVDATGCLVAHPLLTPLLDATFGRARQVVLRASAATGERVAWCRPTARDVAVPAGVTVVDDRAVRRGHGAITEDVAGRRFRISPASFFQSGPVAAAALAGAVADAVPPGVASVADLYAGVGLFASVVGAATGAAVEAVELDPSAAADARVNLADLDATVVHGEVRAWQPDRPAGAVVADPGRPGLAAHGVAAVARADAPVVVLVSCDPASLARDARLLSAVGYRLERVRLVDAFPHTPHVEAVSEFHRSER